jgi:hypothetical protein
VEQLCDVDNNGHVDNEPIMPSIVVLNYGHVAELEDPDLPPVTTEGDLTRVYEAIPYDYRYKTCYADIMGSVDSYDAGDDGSQEDDTVPLKGVTVEAPTGDPATTDSTGGYEVTEVESGEGLEVVFSKSGYLTGTVTTDLDCGEDLVQDCELPCLVSIDTTVYVSDTDNANLVELVGATVDYSVPAEKYTGADCAFDPWEKSGETDSTGDFTFSLPLFDDDLTFTVTPASPYVEPRTFTKAIMDEASKGTYGITPKKDGGPLFNDAGDDELPFVDTDCAWNPNADLVKDIHDTVLCAYGQFAGLVFVDIGGTVGVYDPGVDVPAEGVTVTATRIDDNEQWTDETNANGFYLIQVPTGLSPDTGAGDGNVFSLEVSSSAVEIEFEGCGEHVTTNFDL